MAAPDFAAIHLALTEGYPDIVKCLLKHGADPELKDGKDRSPLDLRGKILDKVLEEKKGDVESCADVLVSWIHENVRKCFSPSSADRSEYIGHEKKDILEGMSDIEKSLEDFKKAIKSQIDNLKIECEELTKEKKEETDNLNTDVQQNQLLVSTISDLEKYVTDSTEKITAMVEQQRQLVVDDIDETISATNSFYSYQYNDTDVYNDYTYFRIFLKIAYEVGSVKGLWVELLDALLKNYPKSFVEAITEEIKSSSCVSEKECCLEVLTRWKVYSSANIDKLDRLDNALKEINMGKLKQEIDDIIEDNVHSGADDIKVNLTDSVLDGLAKKIGKEWVNIGIELGYERAELDRFEMNNKYQTVEATKAMFINWRDNVPGIMHFKFGVLAEAFKGAKRMDLANDFLSNTVGFT